MSSSSSPVTQRTYLVCPDGTMCENSSACINNPYDEGSYYCDCANADSNKAVAGLYCEFAATTYCTQQQSMSRTAFCSNNGKCLGTVSGNQAHPGCQCPSGYTGPHCEYVGIQPGGYPYDGSAAPNLNNSTRSTHELRAGIKALIALVVIAVFGMFAFVLYKKRRSGGTPKSTDNGIKDSSSSLHLEADGALLNEAVQENAIMAEENGSNHHHPVEHMNGEDGPHATQLI